eukprot:316332-Chlamydomonas_euryale.AAC.1
MWIWKFLPGPFPAIEEKGLLQVHQFSLTPGPSFGEGKRDQYCCGNPDRQSSGKLSAQTSAAAAAAGATLPLSSASIARPPPTAPVRADATATEAIGAPDPLTRSAAAAAAAARRRPRRATNFTAKLSI